MTAHETGHGSTADRTAVITLGHAGLAMSKPDARRQVESILLLHRATILGTFHDGEGEWEGAPETCDAWLVLLPVENLPHVGTCLERLAWHLGQESIGYVIHAHETHGESYVLAVPPLPPTGN